LVFFLNCRTSQMIPISSTYRMIVATRDRCWIQRLMRRARIILRVILATWLYLPQVTILVHTPGELLTTLVYLWLGRGTARRSWRGDCRGRRWQDHYLAAVAGRQCLVVAMAGRRWRDVVALEDRWRQNGVEHVFFA